MGKHANSIDSQILQRIRRRGAGYVFTPADFLDLGSRNAIDLALSRQARAGTIRKLARGLYDFPRVTRGSVPLSPGIDDIADGAERPRPIAPATGRGARRQRARTLHPGAGSRGVPDRRPLAPGATGQADTSCSSTRRLATWRPPAA